MSVMLWPGTVGAATSTPPRAPGSVRRTSTVDIRRPDGMRGDLLLEGRARDLLTRRDGTTAVLDEVRTTVVIDVTKTRRVQAIDSSTDETRLAQLIGAPAGSGFRNALDEVLPDRCDDGSLLMLLLDEVPVTTLISGSAMIRALALDGTIRRGSPPTDICAGWMDGGAMDSSSKAGEFTFYGQGPAAPNDLCTSADDPLAWHRVDPLAPWDMRRARRLDVTADDTVRVEGVYRDSCVIEDGTAQVVHEYALRAEADTESYVIRSIDAIADILPGPQCPLAVDSAQRLVGQKLTDVRRLVRDSFVGPTTCTHLNDELRAFGDVHALVRVARERV